jgi:hypothetical protein
MNRIRYLAAAGISILLMGCPARSLFPLFTNDDTVFNPILIGTWVDHKNGDTFSFQKSGEKNYQVILREQMGKGKVNSEAYTVLLGQIDKFWFIDSYPTVKNGSAHHSVSAHILSRIWIDQDTLRMASLEDDWLKAMIDADKIDIAHVRRGDDIILTATTDELQTFAAIFAEDNNAFPNQGVLVRKK